MLGKLLKYEFKSTSRTFFILYPVIIILAILSKISILAFPDSNIMTIPRILITMLYVLSIIFSIFATFFMVIYRFYKNLVSNEGYLMWTLPVKASTHIIAKLITAFVWQILSIFVSIGSILIVIPEYDWIPKLPDAYAKLSQEFTTYTGASLTGIIWLTIALLVVAIIFSYMNFFTALSFGNLASKNKILLSVGAFVAQNVIFQTVTMTIISISLKTKYISNEFLDQSFPPANIIYSRLGLFILIYAVYAVAEFFISKYILKNKLNLQ